MIEDDTINQDIDKESVIKRVISKIIVALTMIWIYLPIIGGIITPMFYLLPLLYYSWYLFELPIGGWWISGWVTVNSLALKIIILVVETISVILGCYLLISGIFYLARARKNKISIVKTGPYKSIRHPQHLGIILIILPFALIISPNDWGIRIADLFSFLLNAIILMIVSEVEEIKMQKKFPREYSLYKKQTGFFFPRIRNKTTVQEEELSIMTRKYRIVRYIRIIVVYLGSFSLFVGLIYLILKYTNWLPLIYVR